MLFSQEKIADHLEEAKPLLCKHWAELEFGEFPLDPDYDLYISLERQGVLHAYTARNEEGKLVGYAVYIVRHHHHYKTILAASCDIIFIEKSYRIKGLKFIQWCDEQLKALGVKVIVHTLKIESPTGLLERVGYKTNERRLIKRF